MGREKRNTTRQEKPITAPPGIARHARRMNMFKNKQFTHTVVVGFGCALIATAADGIDLKFEHPDPIPYTYSAIVVTWQRYSPQSRRAERQPDTIWSVLVRQTKKKEWPNFFSSYLRSLSDEFRSSVSTSSVRCVRVFVFMHVSRCDAYCVDRVSLLPT